jgi:hypothetical protein
MSVSIKVKMSDSDEDPEITSGLKKGGFNVTNCSNRYFNFHFDKSMKNSKLFLMKFKKINFSTCFFY